MYPATTTNALGHTSSVTVHPALGVVLDSRDPNGIVPATMKYDRFGRVREVNYADGYFERHSAFGLLARVTVVPDGSGGTITAQSTVLDRLGRPTDRTVPAFEGGFSAVRTTYDRLGRVATISRPHLSGSEDPLQNTTFAYDFRDRLLNRNEPDNVTTRHEYIGRETHTYDGNGFHSYVLAREDGQIGARYEDDPKSTAWLETSFEYGPFGLLRRSAAADTTSQSMEYDARGRSIRHVDPSTGTTTRTYNAFGELRHETTGAGEEIDVQIRDLLGRPWRISSADGLTTYEWDKPGALGQLDASTQNDSNGHYVVTRFSYDEIGRNRRTSWEIDDGLLLELDAGFDTIGRLSSITYPRIPFEPEALSPPRLKVNYAYHPAGYLLSVTDALTGAPYWRADSRQPDGQVTQETHGNGVVGFREYKPETGLLETLTTDGPDGQLDQIVYGYDDNRNVRSRDDVVGASARSQTFTYDTLNRLATWTHQRADQSDPVLTVFDHNAVGNLLSETVTGRTGRNVSYAYGQNGAPPHALTTRNGQAYSHDGGGRRIAGAALGSIIYNRRNLPIRIQRNSGVTVEMAYDAAGTRVLKRTADSTRYSVGGLFERTIGSDVRNQHYIVAEGRPVAEVVHIQEAPEGAVVAKETRYLHSDGQGSAVLVTDESGATVAELFYDPFGRRTDQNYDPLAGTVPVRPGYTGHLHDDELDLIDMKGRVYDIEARRFLTPDPFIPAPLFSQSHNRYSYVWNNPATLIDPTGFHPDDFETETTCFFIVCWSNSTASDGGTSGGGSVGDGGSSTNGVSTTVPQQPAAATPNSSDASGTIPFEPQGSGGGLLLPGDAPTDNFVAAGGAGPWISIQSFLDPTWGYVDWDAYEYVTPSQAAQALGWSPDLGSYADVSARANADPKFRELIQRTNALKRPGAFDRELGVMASTMGPSRGPTRPIINLDAPRTGVRASGSKISAAEQRAVNALGDAHGCWTPGCGARVPGTKPRPGRPQGNWVGDHQLPNSLTAPGAPQFLVPHCAGCSREQGLFLARMVNWFNGANE